VEKEGGEGRGLEERWSGVGWLKDVRAVVEGLQEGVLVVDDLLELVGELFAGEGVICWWGPMLDGGGVVGTGHSCWIGDVTDGEN